MALRVDYVARETGQSLARNPMLTVAAMLTVAVSLAMLAVVFLLSYGISHSFEKWQNDVAFIVYVNPDAPEDQIASLRNDLDSNPLIKEAVYLDKDATWEKFTQLFKDEPSVLETTKKEELPTSFRVKPTNPDAGVVEQISEAFRSKPGVYKVESVTDAVRIVQNAFSKLRTFALVGAFILLLTSLALIVNTIQTAVFARRREIEVMKLVGATNWYIRTPFLLEGLFEGVMGAAIATGLAAIFQAVWRGSFVTTRGGTLFNTIVWTSSDFRLTVILLFVVGAFVGMLGSALSVGRYLRV